MYQTVAHRAPKRRLDSVIEWDYIAFVARRVAFVAAWASLVFGAWGLFLGLGYSLFLGVRLILP